MDEISTPGADLPIAAKVGLGLAAMLCLYASLVSSSQFGPGIKTAGGGVFGPTATLLAPSSLAFVIWTVVYIGLFALAISVWQYEPEVFPRRRVLVWPAILSMLLNALWLLVAMRGLVFWTLPVMVALLVAVVMALEAIRSTPLPRSRNGLIAQWAFGLYFGWLLIAAPANALSVLAFVGQGPDAPGALVLALVLLVASVGPRRERPGATPATWRSRSRSVGV